MGDFFTILGLARCQTAQDALKCWKNNLQENSEKRKWIFNVFVMFQNHSPRVGRSGIDLGVNSEGWLERWARTDGIDLGVARAGQTMGQNEWNRPGCSEGQPETTGRNGRNRLGCPKAGTELRAGRDGSSGPIICIDPHRAFRHTKCV